MKISERIFSVLMSLIIVISMFIGLDVASFASDDIFEYLYYEFDVEGVIIIDCDEGISGDIIIPDTIEGYPVAGIGNEAFFGCKDISSVTIPASVTFIGDYAFYNCSWLQEVTISENVTTIGEKAFGYYTFNGKEETEKGFLIKGTVGSVAEEYSKANNILFGEIKPEGFSGIFDGLKFLISNNVVIITGEDGTASGNLVIPEKINGYPVVAISSESFIMSSFTSVSIPASITQIGSAAFVLCDKIERFIVDEENTCYSSDENGVLFNKEKTVLIKYPMGNNTKEYVIPDGVVTIGDNAFNSCNSITSVVIPDSVTELGFYAFSDCENLKTVKNGVGVEKICTSAFQNCRSLMNITFHDRLTAIGDSAFYGCVCLKNLVFPDSITMIDEYAFCDCASIERIVIPENVAEISNHVFYGCKNLKSVTIPDSVTSIGEYAFKECISLKKIKVPASVILIENMAFGFYCDENTYEDVIVDDFAVIGVPGSAVEIYAEENGITFFAIDSDSSEIKISGDSILIDESNSIVSIEVGKTADEIAKMIENKNFEIVDKDGNKFGNDFVGTGSKIQLKNSNGNVTSQYEIMVPSDVDGNGEITASDARNVLRSSAGMDELLGVYMQAADTDHNGEITASDARKILRKSAGLE